MLILWECTVHYAALPSNYVAYRYGCYCFSNNCVYIPTSTHNNGANAILLKINSNHTITGLTLSGWTESKQFNSCLYSPDDRILLGNSGGILYRIKPGAVGSDDEALDTNISYGPNRFLQCFDKRGVLYSFNNTTSNTFGTTRVAITIDNKEIFNPIFNSLH